MANIYITTIASSSTQGCAERLRHHLESELAGSESLDSCTAKLSVETFLHDQKMVLIKGKFSGNANGTPVSVPFELGYVIENNVSASTWLGSPMFAAIFVLFRMIYSEKDPRKRSNNWVDRLEMEIASEIETQVLTAIGAPLKAARLLWRNSLILGLTLYLITATILFAYIWMYPNPRSNDGPVGSFVIALMGGAFFGFPAGLAGVFLGLLFAGSDIQETVSGKALLKLVGVKSITGLRVACAVGTLACIGLQVGIFYFVLKR